MREPEGVPHDDVLAVYVAVPAVNAASCPARMLVDELTRRIPFSPDGISCRADQDLLLQKQIPTLVEYAKRLSRLLA